MALACVNAKSTAPQGRRSVDNTVTWLVCQQPTGYLDARWPALLFRTRPKAKQKRWRRDWLESPEACAENHNSVGVNNIDPNVYVTRVYTCIHGEEISEG
jgi:hypothetical protein